MGFLDNILQSFTGGVPGEQPDGQPGNMEDGTNTTATLLVNLLKSHSGMEPVQEYPGALCLGGCTWYNTAHCEACLKEQEAILKAFDRLEELDRAVEEANSSAQPSTLPRPTKCSLCGAPVDTDTDTCPFCNTKYPPEALLPEIPRSKREQQQLLLKKATETYKLFSDWADGTEKKLLDSMTGVIGGFLRQGLYPTQSVRAMSEEQIWQGAQYYDISYTEYVLGIIQKKYLTAWDIQQEERMKQNEEDAARRRVEMERREQELEAMNARTKAAFAERNRAIENARAKNRESKRHFYQIQQEVAVTKAKQYVGGGYTSGCCGNCTYFISSGECARTNSRTSASDNCGWHRWK